MAWLAHVLLFKRREQPVFTIRIAAFFTMPLPTGRHRILKKWIARFPMKYSIVSYIYSSIFQVHGADGTDLAQFPVPVDYLIGGLREF